MLYFWVILEFRGAPCPSLRGECQEMLNESYVCTLISFAPPHDILCVCSAVTQSNATLWHLQPPVDDHHWNSQHTLYSDPVKTIHSLSVLGIYYKTPESAKFNQRLETLF